MFHMQFKKMLILRQPAAVRDALTSSHFGVVLTFDRTDADLDRIPFPVVRDESTFPT